tara:strand:+ start:288 stop:473 length:186 start_codon:yes stop_codon:yes gene_type:complete
MQVEAVDRVVLVRQVEPVVAEMVVTGVLVTVKVVRLILEEAVGVMTTGVPGHRIMLEGRVL